MTDRKPGEGGRVVVLRPGALGDVLVTRAALRYLKTVLPDHEIVLVAPGERGRLLARTGWADTVADWDAGWFSWLFSDISGKPPERLAALFRPARLIVAFTQSGPAASADNGTADGCMVQDGLVRQVCRLTDAPVYSAPARPLICIPAADGGGDGLIDYWLLDHVVAAMQRLPGFVTLSQVDERVIRLRSLEDRIPVAAPSADTVPSSLLGRYLAIHPGSGGMMKNWPVERFAAVAEALRRESADALRGVVVTAGEADGDLGKRLAGMISGAVLVENRDLSETARVLAHAAAYVGNDSGVSHLAAAVRPEGGGDGPAITVLFGPSDPGIWCPRGAVPVRFGTAMEDIPVEAVTASVRQRLGASEVDSVKRRNNLS